MNVNRWVDDCLSALDSADQWHPDAARARMRLRQWDRQARIKRQWAWAAAAAACLALLVFIQPRACATPLGCVKKTAEIPAPQASRTMPTASTDTPAPVAAQAAKPQAGSAPPQIRVARNFKESGSPAAPIGCEIYSDYECPSCAAFFRDTLPLLVAEYVETGKVKLLHRDFPLPQHPYAELAARYANAAGEAGAYETAVTQIFKTQDIWSKTGDIEAQLASVLSLPLMRKMRGILDRDPRLGAAIAEDRAMGIRDGLRATPTLVIVWKGKRQAISPIPSYSLLKSYLDDLLARP